MSYLIRRHPVAFSLTVTVLAMAAAACVVLHYLNSWMILPLI